MKLYNNTNKTFFIELVVAGIIIIGSMIVSIVLKNFWIIVIVASLFLLLLLIEFFTKDFSNIIIQKDGVALYRYKKLKKLFKYSEIDSISIRRTIIFPRSGMGNYIKIYKNDIQDFMEIKCHIIGFKKHVLPFIAEILKRCDCKVLLNNFYFKKYAKYLRELPDKKDNLIINDLTMEEI